jgi:hypothetical protein
MLNTQLTNDEVQAAESRNDFIHKLGVILKEIKKECRTALKIIRRKEIIKPKKRIDPLYGRSGKTHCCNC